MTRQNRVLSLDASTAMKVLAHPARRRVLDAMEDEDFTATELAEATGLTASAMSYHLRAMQKLGIVERLPSSDARERRWRLAFDEISFDLAGASTKERTTFGATFLGSLAEDANRLVARWGASGSPSPGGGTRWRAWLTWQEQQELVDAVQEVLDRYAHLHEPRAEGTAAVDVLAFHIPTAQAPRPDQAG